MLSQFVDRMGEFLLAALGIALICLITVVALCGSALMVQGTYRALTGDAPSFVYK
ncbi:hypothetical protein D3C87_1245270 [compost metagenome]